MKANKGFTLIELLAVIVILAVIALIATPLVMNTINDARKGAARDAAYNYIHAVETEIGLNMVSDTAYTVPSTITDASFATVKGTAPTSVSLSLDANGVVQSGYLVINGYTVTITNGNATTE